MPDILTPADLQPLEASELAWRWSSEAHVVLPGDIRSQISALRPFAAEALSLKARDLCSCDPENAKLIPAGGDAAEVARELDQLQVANSERVIVHWRSSDALVMPWSIFRTWWDDFCYPGSDDVTIWPIAGGWVLCYRHVELFLFARQPKQAK